MEQTTPYPLRLETELKYGKHAGKTFQSVLDQDLSWVKWMWRTGKIAFHPHAWDYFMDKVKRPEGKTKGPNLYQRHINRNK